MKNRTSTRSIKTLCALGLGVALSGACGGRAVTVEEGMPAGTGASVGSGAVAGAMGGASGRASGGTGNAIGRGGSASAGTASGGAPGAGASNTCDAPCPPLQCDSNSSIVFPNGACCPACVSNCSQQACPGIACPSGYQLQTQPGQCCPSCVPSTMVDCATGQKSYASLRDALLSKYAYGCSLDADCTAAAPINRCEPGGCSFVPIWRGALDNLNSNLSSEAAIDCAACGVVPAPPCASSGFLRCVNQQCQFWMPDDR